MKGSEEDYEVVRKKDDETYQILALSEVFGNIHLNLGTHIPSDKTAAKFCSTIIYRIYTDEFYKNEIDQDEYILLHDKDNNYDEAPPSGAIDARN